MIIGLSQGAGTKLGEQKASKEGAGSAGKPLMNGNNRPVVLLNLFFPERQISNKGYVEFFFNLLYAGLFGLIGRSIKSKDIGVKKGKNTIYWDVVGAHLFLDIRDIQIFVYFSGKLVQDFGVLLYSL